MLCRRHAPSWLQPHGYHLVHRLLAVLAPETGALVDGPCPACHGPLPVDAWHHLLVHCDAFPALVPVECRPWVALGREFGLGYPIVAATAQYLPVLELAQRLLVPDAAGPTAGPATAVLEAPCITTEEAPGSTLENLACWGLPVPCTVLGA